jgi:O-antigen ligase
LYGLGNLFLHPLGWNDPTLDHQFFMHNLWLDVARVSGIIPFLCLFIATIRPIKHVYNLFRTSNSVTTIILVSIFSTLFMACFMEPALEAKQVAVYFFIFIWGVIAGVLRNKTLYNECNTIK